MATDPVYPRPLRPDELTITFPESDDQVSVDEISEGEEPAIIPVAAPETSKRDAIDYNVENTFNAIAPVIKEESQRLSFIASDVIDEVNLLRKEQNLPLLDYKRLIDGTEPNYLGTGDEENVGVTDKEIIMSFTGAEDEDFVQTSAESFIRTFPQSFASGKVAAETTKLVYNATPLLPRGLRIGAAGVSGAGAGLATYFGTTAFTDAVLGERAQTLPEDLVQKKALDIFFGNLGFGIPLLAGTKNIPQGISRATDFLRQGSLLGTNTTELGFSIGAASGGSLAQLLFPGETGKGLVGEVAGSIFNPLNTPLKLYNAAKASASTAVSATRGLKRSKDEARQQGTADFLSKAFEETGEDKAVVLRNLQQTGRTSKIPAVRASSETLMFLAESLSRKNTDFAKILDDAATEDFINVSNGTLHKLISSWTKDPQTGKGVPGINVWAMGSEVRVEAAREIFKTHILSQQGIIDAIQERISEAGGSSDASRRQASEAVVGVLQKSLKDFSEVESASYDKIDDLFEVNDVEEFFLTALYKAKSRLDETLFKVDNDYKTWLDENYFYSKEELIDNKIKELTEAGFEDVDTFFSVVKNSKGEAIGNSNNLSEEALKELATKTKGNSVETTKSNPLQEALGDWKKTAGKIIKDGDVKNVPLDTVNFNFFDSAANNTVFSEYIKPLSIKQMLLFRSRLLEDKNKLFNDGDIRRSGAYGELSDGIFNVLKSLKDDIVTQQNSLGSSNPVWDQILNAYELTRAKNDIFTRSVIGDSFKKTSQRGVAQDPGLALQKAFAGSRDQRAINYNEFKAGIDYLGRQITDAATVDSRLDDFNSQLGVFFNNLAKDVFRQENGETVLNEPALKNFLKLNEEVFKNNPQLATLYDDLTDAQTATNLIKSFSVPELGQFNTPTSLKRILNGPDEVFNAFVKKQAKVQLWILGSGESNPSGLMQGVFASKNPEKSLDILAKEASDLGKAEKEGFRDFILDYVTNDLRNSVGKNPYDQVLSVRNSLFGPLNNQTNQASLFTVLARNGVIDKQFTIRMKAVLNELEDIARISDRRNIGLSPEGAVPENLMDFFQRKLIRGIGALGGRNLKTGTIQVPQATADLAEKLFQGVPDVVFQDILMALSSPKGEKMLEIFLRKTPSSEKSFGRPLTAKEMAKNAKNAIKDAEVIKKFLTSFFPTPTTALIGASARYGVEYQNRLDLNKEKYKRIREDAKKEILERREKRETLKKSSFLGSSLPTQPNPASSLSQRPQFQGQPAQPQQRSQFANMFPNDITSNIINSRNRGGIGSLV